MAPPSQSEMACWMTYEEIANTGATTTLSGVLKLDGTRFFALIEEACGEMRPVTLEFGQGKAT